MGAAHQHVGHAQRQQGQRQEVARGIQLAQADACQTQCGLDGQRRATAAGSALLLEDQETLVMLYLVVVWLAYVVGFLVYL